MNKVPSYVFVFFYFSCVASTVSFHTVFTWGMESKSRPKRQHLIKCGWLHEDLKTDISQVFREICLKTDVLGVVKREWYIRNQPNQSDQQQEKKSHYEIQINYLPTWYKNSLMICTPFLKTESWILLEYLLRHFNWCKICRVAEEGMMIVYSTHPLTSLASLCFDMKVLGMETLR